MGTLRKRNGHLLKQGAILATTCGGTIYQLVDCASVAATIYTSTNLAAYVGLVVRISGSLVCYQVSTASGTHFLQAVSIIASYATCTACAAPLDCEDCITLGLQPSGYTVTISGYKGMTNSCGFPMQSRNDEDPPYRDADPDSCTDQLGSLACNGTWSFARTEGTCLYHRTSTFAACGDRWPYPEWGVPTPYMITTARGWAQITLDAITASPRYLRVQGHLIGDRHWDTPPGGFVYAFDAGAGDPANDDLAINYNPLIAGATTPYFYFLIDECGRLIGETSQEHTQEVGPPEGVEGPCYLVGSCTVSMTG